MRRLAMIALASLVTACSWMPRMPSSPEPIPVTEQPVSWPKIAALPAPTAGRKIAYGPAPQQFGILRLPDATGDAPVAVLIHGGCWLNQFDLDYFEHWAQWLTEQGYATWNLEYRRLGDPGGGWPGTFQDIARGLDHLRGLANESRLDLDKVIGIGHSAGGQLALWAASRPQIGPESALYSSTPLAVKQVIGLAPITDLHQYRVGPANSCHASVDPLLGGSPEQVPERYDQASPRQRLPLSADLVMINGSQDTIVAPGPVGDFVASARAAGDPARLVLLPGAGHFDTAVPTPASRLAMHQALGLE